MFEIFSQVAFLAIAASFIQAEASAVLSAISYARKVKGSSFYRVQVGITRYTWASVLFHGITAEIPAYDLLRTTVVWFGAVVVAMAAQLNGIIPQQSALPLYLSLWTAVGFFVAAYGKSFVAQRVDVAESIKAGTWEAA